MPQERQEEHLLPPKRQGRTSVASVEALDICCLHKEAEGGTSVASCEAVDICCLLAEAEGGTSVAS